VNPPTIILMYASYNVYYIYGIQCNTKHLSQIHRIPIVSHILIKEIEKCTKYEK